MSELYAVRDADPRLFGLYLRHYSSEKSRGPRRDRKRGGLNARRFIGNGEHIGLLTTCGRAGFAWRRQDYRKDGQVGIECSLFRNEGPWRSSGLIRAAVAIANRRWPGSRLFTYCKATVDRSGRLIRWGECFLHAGWRIVDIKGCRFLWELPA